MPDEIDPTLDPTVEPVIDAPEGEAGGDDDAPSYNPSWDEAWADVPEPIREVQKPVFDKWDRNYKHLEARFTPYKEFEEQGIDPGILKQAVAIQQALLEDPRGFWERMAENWGFESAAAAKQAFDDGADDDDDVDETTRLKRELQDLQAWREQQSQMTRQQEEQFQQEQRAAQWRVQIQSELDGIEKKNGQFDRDRVVERAMLNAMNGRNPSLENAYYEVRQQEDQIIQRATKAAPRVLGAGGGAAPQAPAKEMTADEQRQAARALAARMAGMGNGSSQ